MKIVKIEGFRGIITAIFICACLFAGFVIFPGYIAMYLWNKYLVGLFQFPVLNLIQGILLWGITAVSYTILTKNNFAVSFKTAGNELSDSELNMIMKNAKIYSNMKKMNQMMNKGDKFLKSTQQDENITPIDKSTNKDDQDKIA